MGYAILLRRLEICHLSNIICYKYYPGLLWVLIGHQICLQFHTHHLKDILYKTLLPLTPLIYLVSQDIKFLYQVSIMFALNLFSMRNSHICLFLISTFQRNENFNLPKNREIQISGADKIGSHYWKIKVRNICSFTKTFRWKINTGTHGHSRGFNSLGSLLAVPWSLDNAFVTRPLKFNTAYCRLLLIQTFIFLNISLFYNPM